MEIKEQYVNQINQQNHLIAFQKMVLDVSFKFMNINKENFDHRVDYLLKSIGTFFEVDQTYHFKIDHKNQTMTHTHEWCDDGIHSKMGNQVEVPLDAFPWWVDELYKNQLVHVNDSTKMAAEASAEQKRLHSLKIKSSISVPVMIEGEVQAFIGVASIRAPKKWTEENIELLSTMAQILARGMMEISNDEKIDFMAYYDPLTELPNQSLLAKRLKKGIRRAENDEMPIAIFFLDLDGFKAINDALGHKQGDQLLKQVAQRLLSVVAKSETVCRRGGDEFIIYLNTYQDEEDLEDIALEIIDLFKKPFILKDQEYFITASIGISQYPVDGEDIPTLISNADMAMYEAKSLGKNQYLQCSEQLKEETEEKIRLTNDLYHAIERDELLLHFQPQVKGDTGEIVGMETLLRWDHPEYGFVPPFKFIPVAEKTRLILPIGYWVLETACRQWVEWNKQGLKPVKIAVNFSGHQLTHPEIIDQIKEILNKTAMPPEYLEIEITESVALDDSKAAKEALMQLKKLGIALSIDDYGKEYSSLQRLKESAVNAMKIDMSFIQGIGVNPKDEIIIRTLLSMARKLGIYTVAEGVETKEQVEFLNQTCCVQLQGYYFHKPMPACEIERLLTL